MVPNHKGTVTSIPARNGPTTPDSKSICSGKLNEGMIVINSSPAKKVEDASDRDVDKSVLPKNDIDGVSVLLVVAIVEILYYAVIGGANERIGIGGSVHDNSSSVIVMETMWKHKREYIRRWVSAKKTF